MTDVALWVGSLTWKASEVSGRDIDAPWVLDTSTCKLKCRAGYWSNLSSNWAVASTLYDQHCTSDNCQKFDNVQDDVLIGPETCLECWQEAQIVPYTSWDGRASYTTHEVEGRDNTEPWTLDTESSICKINCKEPYWVDYTDAWDQRCISDNCKTFNHASGSDIATRCTSCFAVIDMVPFSGFPAFRSYFEQEIIPHDTAEPWTLVGNICRLNCAAGYWSNFNSKAHVKLDLFDQRCTSDNCKAWGHALNNPGQTAKRCTECFDKADMEPYTSWDGKGSYTLYELAGRDIEAPWELDNNYLACKLTCLPKYWSNYSSKYNTASGPTDQRCTSTNCKDWDYASNLAINTSDICTACWADSDIADYENWDARTHYKAQEMAGRDSSAPFVIDLASNTCKLVCSAGYWSNWGSAHADYGGDKFNQRCTYFNCKEWAHDDPDLLATNHECTMCWDGSDVANALWDARSTYF